MLKFVVLALLGASCRALSPEVGWQAHSYNDIREWHQLFLKSASFLKVDPQFVEPDLCGVQARVANASAGCLLLNHNTIDTSSRRTFNTTDDVLAALTNPTNRPFLTGATPFTIALCFKGDGGGCDGSTTGNMWLALVDAFVAKAEAVVAEHGLAVEFVLDGDGVPTSSCKVDRWGWNATYIPLSDPVGGLSSNDPPYAGFQVLDPSAGAAWDVAAVAKWGKFANQELYPYFVWEPSDAPTILSTIDTYVRVGIPHPAGVKFAINIDPVQFEVYAAPSTGNALSHVFGQVGALAGARSAVTAVGGAVVTVTLGESPHASVTDGLSSFAGAQIGAMAPVPSAPSGASHVASAAGFVTIGNASLWTHYAVSNGSLTPVGSTPLSTAVVAAAGVVSVPAPVAFGGALLVVASPSPAGGTVVRGMFANGTEAGSLPALNIRDAAPGSVSLAAVGTPHSVIGVVTSGHNANLTVNTYTVCWPLSGGSPCINCALPDLSCGKTSQAFASHPGSAPSVTVASHGGTPVVLRVWTDGYCPNSETHNKDATTASCEQSPVSTPGVMGYQVQTLAGLLASPGGAPSHCSGDQLHGGFGFGRAPSAVLVSVGGALSAAVVHGGWNGTDTSSGCGLPTPTVFPVLDGWHLPAAYLATL